MLRKDLVKVALAGLIGLAGAMVMPTSASAIIDGEKNTAVSGSLPDSVTEADCTSTEGAKVCYQRSGDVWWVKDTKADGASAEAYWENWLPGQIGNDPYRRGWCTNSLGNGKWGYCNKNYYEDSSLIANAQVWDHSNEVGVRIGPDKYFAA